MELSARISHLARPATIAVALGAMLALLAGSADADAAKRKKKRYPVVTSVSPMNAKVGETITIRGRYFIRGKNKNSVVFKRDGARAVFAKKTLGTAKQIRVVVPESLRRYLTENVASRVRIRVLSERFGKKFTAVSKSPRITALPVPASGGSTGSTGSTGGSTPSTGGSIPAPARVCTGDEDGDWLDATLENSLGLDACKADSDSDGVPDGYEYQAARDLNDDEYQDPNAYLPYPGKRPYPNPLDKDSTTDYDGDGLTLAAEYGLQKTYGSAPASVLPRDDYRLVYSDGEQYSLSTRAGGTGRRTPTQPAAGYAKGQQFLDWVNGSGYNPVVIPTAAPWYSPSNQQAFDVRDLNHSGVVDGAGRPSTASDPGYLYAESAWYDRDGDGYLSDDERDEDADGLTNLDEFASRMTREYWNKCYSAVGELPYPVVYAGTDLTDRDSDGDGIIDGADDQDHDDVPNVQEVSRNMASGHSDWDNHDGKCTLDSTIPLEQPDGPDPGDEPDLLEQWHATDYGRVNPFNPCLPYRFSRTCARVIELGTAFAPFDKTTDWFALQ